MNLQEIRDSYIKAGLKLVYDDADMRERNAADVCMRLKSVLSDRRFKRNLANAKNNWLGVNVDKVINDILRIFE